MSNGQPLPLKDLFSATPMLARLQQKSALLLAINRALHLLLPRPLQHHCRVANFRRGILVIEVANASWHHRFLYAQTDLLSALRKQHLPELVTIEIKINPSLPRTVDATTSGASANAVLRPLSARSAHLLRRLATRCPLGLSKTLLNLAELEHPTTPDSNS